MPIVLKKISEDKVRSLKAEAARRGVSPSEIVEEALDAWFKFSKNYIVENEAVDDLVWERNREKLSKEYYGKYIVIAGGRIVGVFEDLEELARTLRELKKTYRRIIVVRPGVDERVEEEWLKITRSYKPVECYSYRPGIRLPYPVLEVKAYNMALEEYGKLALQVDTGFEGSILLPRDQYEFFMVGELPRSLWRTYRTLTGTITMRVARTLIEVAGKCIEVFVESPLYSTGKPLIGREVLNKFIIINTRRTRRRSPHKYGTIAIS